MKIESQNFTQTEVDAFLREIREQERESLAARLQALSARLAALAGRIETAPSPSSGWNAREILAHIAVLSKFYGSLAYRIASGKLEELDLLGNVQLRDVVGEQAAQQPVNALMAQIEADHRRTAGFLRTTTAEALQRRIPIGNGHTISADEVARLILCAHLEIHLAQLERALA
jgi:hypothetical protein